MRKTNIVIIMKYKVSLITLISVLFSICGIAQERKIVRYMEYVKSQTDEQGITQPIVSKNQRVNSKAGSIHLVYEDNVFPDSMLISIRAAVEIWEAKLCNKQPIFVYLDYYDLNDDNLSLLCDVYYFESSEGSLPSALNSQIRNVCGDIDMPDAMISFNSNVSWNCNHDSQVNIEGVNVFSSMLRAVALSLGFGTSATTYEEPNKVVFPTSPNKSRFDNLIRSNTGIWMKDLESGSKELLNFMCLGASGGCSIYAYKDDIQYKLYSPATYELGKSLVYLDNKNSLMHYAFGEGNKCFQIDNLTIELLNAIGWNISLIPEELEIFSNQLDETGVGSAYENYTFEIKNTSNKKIVNPKWTYKLFDKDSESPIVIQMANSEKFEIKSVNDLSKYYITSNGDLKGEINFECTIDGVDISIRPYRLSLELKPIIKAITDIEIIKHSNSRSILGKVCYSGADHVTIQVEEDFSSVLCTTHIYEPFLAHMQIDHIVRQYAAWVDIIVSNKYGYVIETIELEPDYTRLNHNNTSEMLNCDNDGSIEIYSLEGSLIYKVKSYEDIYKYLQSGIYIIKIVNSQNLVEFKKVII